MPNFFHGNQTNVNHISVIGPHDDGGDEEHWDPLGHAHALPDAPATMAARHLAGSLFPGGCIIYYILGYICISTYLLVITCLYFNPLVMNKEM